MCPEEDSYFDLCVRVFYGDGKRSQDWILAKEHPKAQTVLKGHLKSEPKTKVVIIRGDKENAMDLVSITFTLSINLVRITSTLSIIDYFLF